MTERQPLILKGAFENKNTSSDSANNNKGRLDRLSYKIRRSPSNLTSHIEKIRLIFDMGDSERLYAAVLDLFLVLKNKGRNLRYRMLEQVKYKLTDEQYRSLASLLESKNADFEKLPPTHFSMLGAGLDGSTTLIKITGTSDKKVRNPLIEARDCIEYSQIEEARCILEKAILKNPESEELHLELLEIYRSARDVENFKNIMNTISFIPKTTVKMWKQTAAFFFKH